MVPKERRTSGGEGHFKIVGRRYLYAESCPERLGKRWANRKRLHFFVVPVRFGREHSVFQARRFAEQRIDEGYILSVT